jgi:type I restriction enzyme R subunit
MESGIDQLLRYANRRYPEDNEECEKLFHYNQVMISTHRDKSRVGTISSRMEHYLEWKDPYPLEAEELGAEPNSQQILISGMLSKDHFLDLIRNFIVFEPEGGRVIKKPARYQQFRSVEGRCNQKGKGWGHLAHSGFRKIPVNGLSGS